MAIQVSNGVTRITPTAWKWYAGAVALAFVAMIMPEYGWAWGLVALFLAAFGSGKLTYLQLDRQRLTIKYMFGAKRYGWGEITDFRLMKIKSGLMTAGTMVSFTKVAQEGSMYAKAAKFLSGGTQSAPTFGIKPKTLLILMSAYQQNLIVSDEIIAKILGKTKFTKGDVPTALASGSFNKTAARPSPATQATRESGSDMSAADIAMRRAAAERCAAGSGQGAIRASAKIGPQGGFGKIKPSVAPRPTFGKSSSESSLIQDSRSRRRRTGG